VGELGGFMQGKKEEQLKLFYTIGLDRLVPLDHPVRRIKDVLDLRFLYRETREFYSTEGKPSIDPIVLFKLYLLGYLFGIPSERRLFREVQVNLAYRWYLGYDLDEPIPDHSIMSKSRQRFSEEVFERLFKHVVQLCKERGLISGDYYFLDSSIIRADASRESFRTKLRTEKEYLEGLQEEEKPRNNFRGHIFDGTVDPDRMGKRRRKAKKNDRMRSSSDPDAELLSRGGSTSLPAYKAHFCVDRRRRVILSVDGSKATEDDLTKVHTLFTESMFAVGKKPHTVVADSHYGGIEGLKYFQDQNIQTCINPRIHDNSEGRFRNTDFTMIVDGQEMECPAGHRVQKQTNNLFRIQFHWPKQLCNSCALKEQCTRSPHGRMVSLYKGRYFVAAQALAQSQRGRKLLRARQIIVEGVIGEAKNFHLLSRCRYRTLHRFRIQLLLTAAAINLKRLMRDASGRIKSGAIAMASPLLTLARLAMSTQPIVCLT
jgi:transposase